MIVVADTSPVRYLILIDQIDVLPKIYGRVVISAGVFSELTTGKTPAKVRDFVGDSPEWLEILNLSRPVEQALTDILDFGESEAIQLATELNADLLLIDEKLGRQVAIDRGLDIIGTLGVLGIASERGLLDFDAALERLEEERFYLSKKLRFSFKSKN